MNIIFTMKELIIEPTDIIIEDDNEQRKKRKLLNDDKKLEIHNENSEHEGMDPTSNFSRLKLFSLLYS